MKYEKFSSRLFKALGAATVTALLTGLLVATPNQASYAAGESDYPYAIKASASASTFYTDDPTPELRVDSLGNLPESITNKNSGYQLIFADMESQKTFFMTSMSLNSYAIPRFFKENSRVFRVVVGKYGSNGVYGAETTSLTNVRNIVAESNDVVIKRGKWEITASGPQDHDVNSLEDRTDPIVYRTNQPLNRSKDSVPDFNAYYGIYLYNVDNKKLTLLSLPGYDSISGIVSLNNLTDSQVVRIKFYIAKSDASVDSVEKLEDIQTQSAQLTILPRAWGVKLTGLTYSQTWRGYDTTLSLKLNKFIGSNSSKTLYVEDVATGKIVNYGQATNTESGPILKMFTTEAPSKYVVHIARKNQYVTNISQLQDIVASSNSDYPQSEDVNSSDYLKSGRFQNGSNPSTSDCQQQCYGDPVNALNGELFENETDLQIEGAIGLSFVRSYSSLRSEESGPLGRGTTFSYNMQLKGDKSSIDASQYITVRQENGSTVGFNVTESADGLKTYIPSSGTQAKLSRSNSGGYAFTRTSTQETFNFDSSGRLTRISDRVGNAIELKYTGGLLSTVTNGASTLTLTWADERVISVTDGINRVDYEYSSGNLTKVLNSQITAAKQYSYYPDNKLQKIVQPNGGAYENTYNDQGQVVSQKNPLGGVTTFAYTANGSQKRQ